MWPSQENIGTLNETSNIAKFLRCFTQPLTNQTSKIISTSLSISMTPRESYLIESKIWRTSASDNGSPMYISVTSLLELKLDEVKWRFFDHRFIQGFFFVDMTSAM